MSARHWPVVSGGVTGAVPHAALWRSYRETRNSALREQLFEQYIGLVHHAARELCQRHPTQLELDDLIGAGTIGLVQALENYDPERGTTFSTLAMPRIRGAILDEIRAWDWLPRSARERRRDANRVLETLRRRLGREPSSTEAAAELGVELAVWLRHADELRDPVLMPLDEITTSSDASRSTLAETLADPNHVGADRLLERGDLLGALGEAFDTLSERDRLILSLSFYERLSLREIGDILRVTESRVSQLRTRALARLSEQIVPDSRAA